MQFKVLALIKDEKKMKDYISLIFNTIVVLKPTPEAKCLLTHSMSDSQFKNGDLENTESICSPEQTLTIKCSAYMNLFFSGHTDDC